MPRGGARVGSGRKPKDAGRTPIAATGAPLTPKVVPIDGGRAREELVSATPPQDLPDEQREFWKRNAPRAIAAGTLVPQTIESFRLLCELDAEKTATKATLDKDGRTFMRITTDVTSGEQSSEIKAHPLTSTYRQLAQRVEALMARFGLAPFGKPIAGGRAKKSAANPWVAIASAAKNGGA